MGLTQRLPPRKRYSGSGKKEQAGLTLYLWTAWIKKGVILQKGTEPTGQIPKQEAKGGQKKKQGLLCVMERNPSPPGNTNKRTEHR